MASCPMGFLLCGVGSSEKRRLPETKLEIGGRGRRLRERKEEGEGTKKEGERERTGSFQFLSYVSPKDHQKPFPIQWLPESSLKFLTKLVQIRHPQSANIWTYTHASWCCSLAITVLKLGHGLGSCGHSPFSK